MELNKNIIEILNYIYEVGNPEVRGSLRIDNNHVSILSKEDLLIKLSEDSLLLFGKYDLQNKIVVDKTENTIQLSKIKEFLELISKSIVRLNHLGISYSCKSYQNEVNEYSQKLNVPFKLFQEKSDSEHNQWYFIGNRSSWRSPLFELVLAESSPFDEWTPHFQIDLDTTLDSEILEQKLKSVFGTGFDWSLSFPNYGTVLGMKILGSINGTKICLGLGTSKRGTEYHRKEVLQEVESEEE